MADYNLFISHLQQEDDLVTEELKQIRALEVKAKSISKDREEKIREMRKEFNFDLDVLVKCRDAVLNGEENEVHLKQEEYDAAKSAFDSHWIKRKESLDYSYARYKKTRAILKKILLYSFIISMVLCALLLIFYLLAEHYRTACYYF